MLIYVAKALVACLLLAGLFYFSDFQALRVRFREADFSIVACGAAIFLAGQFLAAQRWHGILKSGAVDISRWDALRLNMIGTFFGNFLPGQGSGDLVKSGFLFGRFPEQRAFLVASVIYDRLLGLFAIVSVALTGVFILGFTKGDWSLMMMTALLSICIALLIVASFYAHRFHWIWGFLGERMKLRFISFFEHLAGLIRNPGLFFRSFILSVFFQLSWVLALWLMLLAVHSTIPFIPVLLGGPLAVLIASVPISLGGIGVREGAFSLIMQRFGVNADVATAGALFSLIPIFIASLAGAYFSLVWQAGKQHNVD